MVSLWYDNDIFPFLSLLTIVQTVCLRVTLRVLTCTRREWSREWFYTCTCYFSIIESGFRMIWKIMQIEEGIIRGITRRCRWQRWITPSETCMILHIIQKPHPITVVLFIQNISRALKTQNFIETGSHYGLHFSQISGKFLRCCCILDVSDCKISSIYITSGLPSDFFCIFAVIFIS